jgi:hypothetical protein
MPTANATSPRSAKTRRKAARKPSGARRAASTAQARKTTRAKKTAKAKGTRVKATRTRATTKATRTRVTRKAARTRATNQTRSAVRQADSVVRGPISDRSPGAFGDYAERAVLIQVGVALTARDRVVSSVNDTISSYSSTSKAQAQLRRFERRGATARNRLEREVRKARVRVERELRQRRREIEKTVSDLEDRRETVAKNGTEIANRFPELATRVQERILNLV